MAVGVSPSASGSGTRIRGAAEAGVVLQSPFSEPSGASQGSEPRYLLGGKEPALRSCSQKPLPARYLAFAHMVLPECYKKDGGWKLDGLQSLPQLPAKGDSSGNFSND